MNESKADDLLSVLRNLGFKVKEARQRTEAIIERQTEEVPLETLIKEAMAWTRQPTGTLKLVAQEEGEDDVVEAPVPVAAPKTAVRLVWEAPKAEPEQEAVETPEPKAQAEDTSGSTVWIVVCSIIGAITSLIWWVGVWWFLLGFSGLLVFFYFLGKQTEKAST